MKISKESKFFNGLMLRIIMLFLIALAYSLLIDYLDVKDYIDVTCNYYKWQECQLHGGFSHAYDKGQYHTHWTTNHYIYIWMNVMLMFTQFIRIIVYITSRVKNGEIIEPK